MRDLIEGLLKREVIDRIGCRGKGTQELRSHPFFAGLDWDQVYLLKYTPPLIPPRGEVNAADAFDIGNFDDEETKGVKVGCFGLFRFYTQCPPLSFRKKTRNCIKTFQ